jgi:hypothetical protein
VASVSKRDGALRHDTFTSNAGHVPASGERSTAVVRRAAPFVAAFLFSEAANLFSLVNNGFMEKPF